MAKGTVFIDQERCKGCALCSIVCPQEVIQMDESRLNAKGYHPAMLVEERGACNGCAICAVICPDVCITVYRDVPVRRRVQEAVL